MSGYVRYKDKKGREHTCTKEEWEMFEERERKYKKGLFTLIGPYEPAVVRYVKAETPKAPQLPVEIQPKEEKQGATAGPRKQKGGQ